MRFADIMKNDWRAAVAFSAALLILGSGTFAVLLFRYEVKTTSTAGVVVRTDRLTGKWSGACRIEVAGIGCLECATSPKIQPRRLAALPTFISSGTAVTGSSSRGKNFPAIFIILFKVSLPPDGHVSGNAQ